MNQNTKIIEKSKEKLVEKINLQELEFSMAFDTFNKHPQKPPAITEEEKEERKILDYIEKLKSERP